MATSDNPALPKPYCYVIDKEKRLVVSTMWGHVTFAEARALQDQLKNDPDLDPDFDRLIDLTAVTVLDISILEARMIAGFSLFSPKSRCALAATEPAIFGMGRLMQVYHETAGGQEQVCVFYDRDAALKWLGKESFPSVPSNI